MKVSQVGICFAYAIFLSTGWADCPNCLKQVVASPVDEAIASPDRPLKPKVWLIEDRDPQQPIDSNDQPNHWNPVVYGSLRFQVEAPPDALPDRYEVLLDGNPWVYETTNDHATWRFPELGRHLVQARYRMNGVWSRISDPVRFEVLAPPRPEIIGITNRQGVPFSVNNQFHRVHSSALYLKLANVKAGDYVMVYLDGRLLEEEPYQVFGNCFLFININKFAEAGLHSLRVCTLTGGSTCSVASKPSREVFIHYYDARNEAATAGTKFSFRSSASFPRREFGLQGEVIDTEGLVIYEDMTLSFSKETGYVVKFRTNTPEVPATLRLRLIIRDNQGYLRTITLEPFDIKSKSEMSFRKDATEIQDHETKVNLDSMNLQNNPSEVRREGTVRFGYNRADIDYRENAAN